MAECFPIAALNPVNELLLGIFGENFFPTFNAGFQPVDRSKLTNEPTLEMKFPGNGSIKPIGDPKQTHISGYVTGLIGQMGPIFSFFGILFLILDVIRAIIDIICAFFNPEPLIAAIVDLLLNVLPPIIALYPPLSTILMIINVIKLIIAIVVSLLAAIIPILDLIVQNANSIAQLINEGNLNAVNSVTGKLCTLFQAFANELGAFDPISFILEMINFFSTLSSKFFCASDSTCCDSTSCPDIIRNPPSGTATITALVDSPTLGDFIPFLPVDVASFALGESTITIQDTSTQLGSLENYIVDPATLPKTGSADPATIRVEVSGNTWVAKSASSSANTVTLKVTDASIYSVGQSVSYEVIPDTTQLLTANLISLGCIDDIRAASDGLRNRFGSLDSIRSQIGEFPAPDGFRAALQNILDAQQADPTTDRTQSVLAAAEDYLADLADYFGAAVCLGANRVSSEFTVSTQFVTADGKGFSTLQLIVRDASGIALLLGAPANTQDQFSVQFVTTLGTIGPSLFDSTTGAFQASITSETIGRGEISAIFLVNGVECMRPGIIDGTDVIEKVNVIDFISEGGTFARRRRQRQYVQSAGGRRRGR